MDDLRKRVIFEGKVYEPTCLEWNEINTHLAFWQVEHTWIDKILVCKRESKMFLPDPANNVPKMVFMYGKHPRVLPEIADFRIHFTFGQDPWDKSWSWDRHNY